MRHRYEMRGKVSKRNFGTAMTEFYAAKIASYMCSSEPVEVYDRVLKEVIRVVEDSPSGIPSIAGEKEDDVSLRD